MDFFGGLLAFFDLLFLVLGVIFLFGEWRIGLGLIAAGIILFIPYFFIPNAYFWMF